MSVKSTRAPARRKTNSAALPHPVYLTYEMRKKKAMRDLRHFMDSHEYDDPVWKVVGHVCPFPDPIAGWKEIRRLLDESIAKCKVIPFPVGGKRDHQIAKGA